MRAEAGSQADAWHGARFTVQSVVQTLLNITINQAKQGCQKMPLRDLGRKACNTRSCLVIVNGEDYI
jgi:hypothetical protein